MPGFHFIKKKLCNSSLKLQRVIHTVSVPNPTALMAKGLTEHGTCYIAIYVEVTLMYSSTSIALVLPPIIQAQVTNEIKLCLHLHG